MNDSNSHSLKVYLLFAFFILSAIALLFYGPIYQDPEYHNFVDKRVYWGIPNIIDVLSNLFFLFVGAYGIYISRNNKLWLIFFISICLVAPGSAYYHWSPNNNTLIWDRLPMSLGFMALYIILLKEHRFQSSEKFLWPALIFGASSVAIWALTDDLRIYVWVQFSSFITIPLILILFKSQYSHKSFYIGTLICYFLAKFFEHYDEETFNLTNNIISGHSLKHIIAAFGIYFLIQMLKVRKEQIIS